MKGIRKLSLFSSVMPAEAVTAVSTRPEAANQANDCYPLTRFRIAVHRFLGLLPPFWRELVAERWFRRKGVPGPAAEHVVQYLLSSNHGARKHNKEATIAHGADSFYEKQYRQFLNATMGAFAMTATQVCLASGGAPRGRLWGRHRKTFAAILEQFQNIPPITVLDEQTVAISLWLPKPENAVEHAEIGHWLSGRGAMPSRFRKLAEGESVRSFHRSVSAFERSADGTLLDLIDMLRQSTRLALLALHPHDPDAMGLHISLFGLALLTPEQLAHDYGLEPAALAGHLTAAEFGDRLLIFAVGGTEEVFTQCSQNLFVKRPKPNNSGPLVTRPGWNPALPLERLLREQFETIQVTVSSSGLPGASPRNGDRGKAVFVGKAARKQVLLIPYHPGNFIHGHAAKLWSNPYSSLVISDDHHALTRVTISGPGHVLAHAQVKRAFPEIAAQVANQKGRNGTPLHDPEYWFVQEVKELVQQREPLAANTLEPGRATCTISAGGQALHGKKPSYFAAGDLPAYDRDLQHARETAGNPLDPSGSRNRIWQKNVKEALDLRQAHLRQLLNSSV